MPTVTLKKSFVPPETRDISATCTKLWTLCQISSNFVNLQQRDCELLYIYFPSTTCLLLPRVCSTSSVSHESEAVCRRFALCAECSRNLIYRDPHPKRVKGDSKGGNLVHLFKYVVILRYLYFHFVLLSASTPLHFRGKY